MFKQHMLRGIINRKLVVNKNTIYLKVMEYHLVEPEFRHYGHQQYCNYPEISKSFKSLLFDEEEQNCNATSSSSGLPSYTSAISVTCSQQVTFICEDESPSLTNFLKLSFSSGEDSTDTSEDSQKSEEQISDEEEQVEEETQPVEKQKGFRLNAHYIDPEGWIKYASDPDPWNEKFYTETASEKFAIRSGILTCEEISERTSNLTQLPDSKAFVFSRLHINKMNLENISVLSNYRYFLYIDMSWNLICDLSGLNKCHYLIYLNVSHNKICKVLDFKPPWFLTHVNLCCNEIKEIGTGNLSEFWSLRYLDLSYNLIKKIEGLQDLRYLTYLNLSHNFISHVENLHCTSLQKLDLSFNKIRCCAEEDECLQNLKDLSELNLEHNFLTTLHHFENLTLLKKLNVSDNKITEFSELYCIDGFKTLKNLELTGNTICSTHGYREFLIFKLASLEILDSVLVTYQERVAARMLWEPDIFTEKNHLRTKIKFWNQLATQPLDPASMAFDEPPIPLVVLVGTFGNNKKEIAKRLEIQFPDQVYRCNQVATMPTKSDRLCNYIKQVSIDDFNNMIKAGTFLFYYKETGCLFGVGVDQLCKCIEENKIGIIETTLEGALVLRSTGCRPFLVLCVFEDTNKYEEKLNQLFTDPEIWNSFISSNIRERNDDHGDSVANEGEESSDVTSSFNVSSLSHCTRTNSPTSSLSYQSFPCPGTRWSDMRSGNQKSQYTNKMKTITTKLLGGVFSKDDDEFEWEWTYEPSFVRLVEPSESYRNLLRGQEVFVRRMLRQQSLLREMNHSHPSVFAATVITDNIDNAVKEVGKICCDIYNKRALLTRAETLLARPVCKKFVEARVQSLMKDLINVPTGI